MRILAIDCATEACSLALFERETLIGHRHEILGRGHAEHLVPLIASLPENGRAAEIRVSLGPGSFTGVRIGLAAAKALGLAWRANVLGFPTLALVAATARRQHPGPVSVCMAGGHGEWFVQDFDSNGMPQDPAQSITSEAAKLLPSHAVIAGSRAHERASQSVAPRQAVTVLPEARYVLDLPSALLTIDANPMYGRGPDARLPA